MSEKGPKGIWEGALNTALAAVWLAVIFQIVTRILGVDIMADSETVSP